MSLRLSAVAVGPLPRWFVAVAAAEVGRREGGIPGSLAEELVEEGILAGQLVGEGSSPDPAGVAGRQGCMVEVPQRPLVFIFRLV